MSRLQTALLTILAIFASGCTNSSLADRTADSRASRPTTESADSAPFKLGDWAEYRGPKRDGISQETAWTTDWPADGPRQLWKAAIGVGFSSVSVVGDRLFTMGHTGENDNVYCLSASTGRPTHSTIADT